MKAWMMPGINPKRHSNKLRYKCRCKLFLCDFQWRSNVHVSNGVLTAATATGGSSRQKMIITIFSVSFIFFWLLTVVWKVIDDLWRYQRDSFQRESLTWAKMTIAFPLPYLGQFTRLVILDMFWIRFWRWLSSCGSPRGVLVEYRQEISSLEANLDTILLLIQDHTMSVDAFRVWKCSHKFNNKHVCVLRWCHTKHMRIVRCKHK